ncbi:MAG: phosphotransferase family protein [Saprospiraceae bacterium]|nr:phosphotransferase family protein [Saprospiraceae bacterium]
MGLIERIQSVEIQAYLSEKMPYMGQIKRLKSLRGGRSNPNILIDADHGRFVLRAQPDGKLLSKAHDMGREYKVLSALGDTSFPCPKVYFLCQDKNILGVDFYLMDYIEGDISQSFYLPHLDNEQRRHTYIQLVEKLADLHELDVNKIGLNNYGSQGNYYERQYHRWKKAFEASGHPPNKFFSELCDWLGDHLPVTTNRVLVHGDYRLDNVVFDKGSRNIKAVLDWELSTLGDGLSDLGYLLGILDAPKEFVFPGFGNVDRKIYGMPEEFELLEIYCERRGIESIENWPFYKSFGYFRLASICAGIYGRVAQGNAIDPQSSKFAKMVEPLCKVGCSIII